MKKYTLTCTAVLTVIAFPTFAQDGLICDEETMLTVGAMVEAAPEASKELAVGEFTMAQEKMDAGDAVNCSIHLNNASKASAQE